MIKQINIFICENCGHTSTELKDTSFYDDPVVGPPNNEKWDYMTVTPLGEIKHKEILCCEKCLNSLKSK